MTKQSSYMHIIIFECPKYGHVFGIPLKPITLGSPPMKYILLLSSKGTGVGDLCLMIQGSTNYNPYPWCLSQTGESKKLCLSKFESIGPTSAG